MKFLTKFLLFCSVIVCYVSSDAQVIIKELREREPFPQDSAYFNLSRTRNILNLNGRWDVYVPGETDKKTAITVPATFSGVEELIYEKDLKLSQDLINNKNLQVNFLGVNYSAEIMLNNFVIYKHPGGEFPFKIDLPRDILKPSGKNILAVKVINTLLSDATIPVKQRFLFPQSKGGVFRDVYIVAYPKISISSFNYSYIMQGNGRAFISLNTNLLNSQVNVRIDSTTQGGLFSYRVRLLSPNGQELINSVNSSVNLPVRKEKNYKTSYEISNPPLWSPSNPVSCRLIVQLFRGEQLIDEMYDYVSFYSLVPQKNSLFFNGAVFTLNGICLSTTQKQGQLISVRQMRDDIKLLKSVGFNAIRFDKEVPHPYYLKLCQELGLLAFIEIPINSVPSEITNKNSFYERSRSYFSQFINAYRQYSAVAAIGLGSGYLSNSENHIMFLRGLLTQFKKSANKLFYASFIGYDIPAIEGLDLYGVELFNSQNNGYKSKVENLENKIGRGRVFISSAAYTSYLGSSNGYLNPFSYEAQAKFISDLLNFTIDNDRSGYFITSAFDFRGDYASLASGYNSNNLYSIGIIGEDRSSTKISEKVIYSKLNNTEEVTIPLGTKKDDAPMIFILQGMVIALVMGFLINSKKKFREDASRALLRPYNFYSDIRDQRILSGFHSNFLMFILSATSGLLLVNLLYYFRNDFLLDKIILAFGIPSFSKVFAFLAWNPVYALIWLTVGSIVFFVVLSIFVKIASFFNRSKVFFSSIYFMVIWSFLPLVLLLPLGLILYKILSADFITLHLLIGLVVFTIWVFYRLMKGIYVLFDVVPGQVYFYSIVIILLFVGGVLLYFQITESTIYYILNAYQQYKLM